ncbi:MAG: hypothetical protein Q9167_007699, partial [Letrouitia subvulpina]
RALCMEKRWKFRRKNGDIVIVRDVYEKIIKWVSKFKEVGDVAVQYDPGHASIPWAAVRFFLQLSINGVQIFGAMTEGMELVANHITRSALCEQLYLQGESVAKAQLEVALVKLYAAILKYLAKARKYYDKSTLHRMGKSVFETSDSSIRPLLAKIAEEQIEVDSCCRLVDAENQLATLELTNVVQTSIDSFEIGVKGVLVDRSRTEQEQLQRMKSILDSLDQQPILRIADHIADVHDELEKERRRNILCWMSMVPSREHHKSAWATVMAGSGKWLQQTKEYIDWKRSSSSSILWIHGIPGCGKSKLICTIVQHLLDEKATNPSTSSLAYFYCAVNAAEPQRSDSDEIMRAILKQISCFDANHPIQKPILREYRKRERDAEEDGLEPSKLTLEETKNMILELTELNLVVIVIDALDECDAERRYELIDSLEDIVEASDSLVKILVSSRDDIDVVSRLDQCPNIYVGPNQNSKDINRFIGLEVNKVIQRRRLLNGKVTEQLKDSIIQRITSDANGMQSSLHQWI